MKIEEILNRQEQDYKNKESLLSYYKKQDILNTINKQSQSFEKNNDQPIQYKEEDLKNVEDFYSEKRYKNLLKDPLALEEQKLASINAKLYEEISENKKILDGLLTELINDEPINFDFESYAEKYKTALDKALSLTEDEVTNISVFFSKDNSGNESSPKNIDEQINDYKETGENDSFFVKVLKNIQLTTAASEQSKVDNPGIPARKAPHQSFEDANKDYEKTTKKDKDKKNDDIFEQSKSASKKSNLHKLEAKLSKRSAEFDSTYTTVAYWFADLMYYMSGKKTSVDGQQMGGEADYPGSFICKKSGAGLPIIASFILWQTTLHGMNPQFGKGQIWSPTALASVLAPGVFTDTADTGFLADLDASQKIAFDIPSIAQVEMDYFDPVYGDITAVEGKPKIYTRPLINYTRGFENTIQKGVTGIVLDPQKKPTGYMPGNLADHSLKKQYRNVIFGDNYFTSGRGSRFYDRDAAFNLKDTKISDTDIKNGVFLIKDHSAFTTALKEKSYVPFFFKDLRPVGDKNRYLVFRAFIDSISESFSPAVSTETFFGRTDPVLISETSVTRNIDLSFKMVALSPNDVDVIYKKLNWLTSLVYNEYDPDGYVKYGPLLQLRVGDLICDSSNNGINGKITSLKYDYGKYMWEIGNGDGEMQVPLAIDISLGFTVSHSKPIKIQKGKFETSSLRKAGDLKEYTGNN